MPRPAGRCLSLAVTLTAGCANLAIHSEVAPGTALSAYHSYAWQRANPSVHAPESILDQKVRSALREELARKNLIETTSGSPDFLIEYHVLQEHVTGVTDWGNGIYGWSPEVNTYSEGTLIVDFIDPRTNRVFWRGSANDAIEPPGVVNAKRLQRAAAAMVQRYPSQLAATASAPKL